MSDPGDFYDLLGVTSDASTEEIRQAYRERVKVAHPDRGGDERRFKRIVRAHDVLSDPVERRAYDRLGHEAYLERRTAGSSSTGSGEGGPADASGSRPESASGASGSDATARTGSSGGTTQSASSASTSGSGGASRSRTTGDSGGRRRTTDTRTSTRSRSSRSGRDQGGSVWSRLSTRPAQAAASLGHWAVGWTLGLIAFAVYGLGLWRLVATHRTAVVGFLDAVSATSVDAPRALLALLVSVNRLPDPAAHAATALGATAIDAGLLLPVGVAALPLALVAGLVTGRRSLGGWAAVVLGAAPLAGVAVASVADPLPAGAVVGSFAVCPALAALLWVRLGVQNVRR